MTSTLESDLSRDAFLGGKLWLLQPRAGYRAGVDPVLLAATVVASTGQTVLDLGCGVGTAALCLGARVPGLTLMGVEREALYAGLAVRNGLNTVQGDVVRLPDEVRQHQFDHVLTNPPYFDRAASIEGPDATREAAMGQDVALSVWIDAAARRVAPKGFLHVIHKIACLPEVLAALPPAMGDVRVLPIAARTGRAADRFILRARRQGRTPFHLCAPLVMHDGAAHLSDTPDYSAAVRAVLRDGAALTF